MAERTLDKPAKKWARNYETIYILRPNVDSDEVAKVATRVRDVIDRMGGKLTKVDVWGKRRLAYNIGNFTRGIFVYLGYSSHGDLIAELERNLRLLDPVMRYQTIVLDERIDLDEVEIDASEVEWADIELGADDDDDEPSTAERLGMAERTEAKAEAKDSDDSEDSGDSDDSEEKAEAKSDDSDDSEEKAEAKSDDSDDSDDSKKTEAKSDDDDGSKNEEEE